MKRILSTLSCLALALGLSAQTTVFRHPGLMHSEEDFQRVKERIAAGEEAAVQSLENLRHAAPVYGDHGGNWAVNVDISRGIAGHENYMNCYRNFARAYQCALLWKITGERGYGDVAVDLLNAYATWNKSLSGNTNISLIPAFNGYQILNAAEIMRDYDGWKKEDIEKFKQYMIDVWFGVAQDFLYRRHDTVTREGNWYHYYSNWGVGNELFCISLGIFCDLPDVYNYGMYWLTEGPGNESIFVGNHTDEAAAEMCGQGWGLMPWFHKDKRGPMGYFAQMQESGRDQGHALASLGLMGNAFQTCYVQGDNLFNNMYNPLVKGVEGSTMGAAAAEYVAAYNNGIDNLPYTLNWWMGGFGPNSRGQWRPIWQLFINAYENRLGIPMPHSKTMHNAMGLEWGGGNYGNNSGGYDHTGWGDLMFNDAPVAEGMAPTPLYPTITGPSILARRGFDPNIKTHHVGWVAGVVPGTQIKMSASLPEGEEDTGLWEWEDGVKGHQRTETIQHAGLYRLYYTNSKGVKSTQLFSVSVIGEGIKASIESHITYRGQDNTTGEQLMGAGTTATLTAWSKNGGYVQSEYWLDEEGKQIATGITYNYTQKDEQDHTVTYVCKNHSGVEVKKEFHLKYDASDISYLLPDAGCKASTKWTRSTTNMVTRTGLVDGTTGAYMCYAGEAVRNNTDRWGLPAFSATQTATDLTPGKYTVSASCVAGQASEVDDAQWRTVDGVFYQANGISLPVATIATQAVPYTIECYVGTDGQLTVGIANLTNQERAFSACGASIIGIDELLLRRVEDADAAADITALRQRADKALQGQLPSGIRQQLEQAVALTAVDWQTARTLSSAVSEAEMVQRVYATFLADAEAIAKGMPDVEALRHQMLQMESAASVADVYAAHDALRVAWLEAMAQSRQARLDVSLLMNNGQLRTPSPGMWDNALLWRTQALTGNFRVFAIDGSDTQRGEAVGDNMIERWCEGNFGAGEQVIYQSLTAIPLGRYTFSAAAQMASAGGRLELFATGSSTKFSSAVPVTGILEMKQLQTSARIATTSGVLSYGLRALTDNATQWATMADLHLYYDSPFALLQEALDEAATLTWGEDKDGKLATAVANAQAALNEETKATTMMTRYNSLLTQIDSYRKNNSSLDHPYDIDAEEWSDFLAEVEAMRQIAAHSQETVEGAKQTFVDAIDKAYDNVAKALSTTVMQSSRTAMEKARQTYVLKAVPYWGYEFDMTFTLTNADISKTTGGWLTDGVGNFQRMTNSEVDGEYVGPFWEKWDIESYYFKAGDRPVYQTAKGLPEGRYRLSMAAFRKNQFNTQQVNKGSMYVYLGDQQTEVTSTVMNYYEVQAECTDGTLELGLKAGSGNNANWEALADAHLYFLGSEDVTGIAATPSASPLRPSATYNLHGQRVDNRYRGIVVKDGKKVLR